MTMTLTLPVADAVPIPLQTSQLLVYTISTIIMSFRAVAVGGKGNSKKHRNLLPVEVEKAMNVAKARYETFLEFLKTKKINLSNHELNKSAHSIKNLVSSSDVAAARNNAAVLETFLERVLYSYAASDKVLLKLIGKNLFEQLHAIGLTESGAAVQRRREIRKQATNESLIDKLATLILQEFAESVRTQFELHGKLPYFADQRFFYFSTQKTVCDVIKNAIDAGVVVSKKLKNIAFQLETVSNHGIQFNPWLNTLRRIDQKKEEKETKRKRSNVMSLEEFQESVEEGRFFLNSGASNSSIDGDDDFVAEAIKGRGGGLSAPTAKQIVFNMVTTLNERTQGDLFSKKLFLDSEQVELFSHVSDFIEKKKSEGNELIFVGGDAGVGNIALSDMDDNIYVVDLTKFNRKRIGMTQKTTLDIVARQRNLSRLARERFASAQRFNDVELPKKKKKLIDTLVKKRLLAQPNSQETAAVLFIGDSFDNKTMRNSSHIGGYASWKTIFNRTYCGSNNLIVTVPEAFSTQVALQNEGKIYKNQKKQRV